METIKNKENERCKADMIRAFKEFGVPVRNDTKSNNDLDCIYYDFFYGTIHRKRGIGIHIRDHRTGELGDSFDYYSHFSQKVRSVICLDVIALIYKDRVIYQNDRVVTKNLNKIKDEAREKDWNRRILDARDDKTGKIDLSVVMKNEKVRYPTEQVNIAVAKQDIERFQDVCGIKGAFYLIHLPDKLWYNGKDLGSWNMLVRNVKIKDGIAEMRFSADTILTLSKNFKKIKLSAGTLNKALRETYLKIEQEKEIER